MQTAQLFENGEYIVIYVDTNTYSEKEAHKYIWSQFSVNTITQIAKKIISEPAILDKYDSCENNDFNGLLKRGRSLFVVVPTAPTENYESFTEKVRYYNSKEPFNFGTSVLLKSFEKVRFWSFFPLLSTDFLTTVVGVEKEVIYSNF